jgi:hypothetical protein
VNVRDPLAQSLASLINGNVVKPSAITSTWFVTRVHIQEKPWCSGSNGRAPV